MCKLGGMNSKYGQKFVCLTVTRVTGHVHGIFSKKLEFGPKKCFISKRSSYGTKKSIMTFYHDLSNFCYGLFSHFWPKLIFFEYFFLYLFPSQDMKSCLRLFVLVWIFICSQYEYDCALPYMCHCSICSYTSLRSKFWMMCLCVSKSAFFQWYSPI